MLPPSPPAARSPALNAVRIVICTSGGIHGSVVLECLSACERIQVVGVIESSRVLRSGYSRARGALEQIRTSGIPYACYLWTTTSLSNTLSALTANGSVAALTRRMSIPRLVTRNINERPGQSFLRELQPDLLVSAFFNQRIAQPVFTIPRAGAINIHPSLLPEYKGVDPVFFARLRGAARLGVTVHRIDAKLDTGHVLFSEVIPWAPEHSVLRVTARLFRHGADLITEHIDSLAEGLPGIPQAHHGTYDSWPKRSDVAALRRSGVALVRLQDLAAIAAGNLTDDGPRRRRATARPAR